MELLAIATFTHASFLDLMFSKYLRFLPFLSFCSVSVCVEFLTEPQIKEHTTVNLLQTNFNILTLGCLEEGFPFPHPKEIITSLCKTLQQNTSEG